MTLFLKAEAEANANANANVTTMIIWITMSVTHVKKGI